VSSRCSRRHFTEITSYNHNCRCFERIVSSVGPTFATVLRHVNLRRVLLLGGFQHRLFSVVFERSFNFMATDLQSRTGWAKKLLFLKGRA
jgi:hypothetical protein